MEKRERDLPFPPYLNRDSAPHNWLRQLLQSAHATSIADCRKTTSTFLKTTWSLLTANRQVKSQAQNNFLIITLGHVDLNAVERAGGCEKQCKVEHNQNTRCDVYNLISGNVSVALGHCKLLNWEKVTG